MGQKGSADRGDAKGSDAKADFIAPKDAFAISLSKDGTPMFQTSKCKALVPSAYAMPALSNSYCAELVKRICSTTTKAEREQEGIDLTRRFFRTGDSIARGLNALLPMLRADAQKLKTAGFDEPLLQRWVGESSEHQELRFVEAVVVCYDKDKHPKIRWHTDSYDLTLNICLGRKDFRGGTLLLSCRSSKQIYEDFFESVCQCPAKGRAETAHIHHQVIGTGVLNAGFVPHATDAVWKGERLNLVLKFVLAPSDEAKVAQQGFPMFAKLFSVLQNNVLTFLGAKELAYLAQTSKAMKADCYQPALWRALYARTIKLCAFVSIDELESGEHLKQRDAKLGLLNNLLRADEEQYRKRVVLTSNDWHLVFALCVRNERIVRELEAARHRRPFGRTRLGDVGYASGTGTSYGGDDSPPPSPGKPAAATAWGAAADGKDDGDDADADDERDHTKVVRKLSEPLDADDETDLRRHVDRMDS